MTVFLVGILEGSIEPLASGYPRPEDLVFHPDPPGRRPWGRFRG
jgi:hypothetical protein